MKRKLLGIVLAVCVLCSLLTVTALAEGETPIAADTTTLTDGTYILNDDVTLTAGALTVQNDVTVTIDLNGHKLTNLASNHTIVNNGMLTIVDSSAEKTGTVDNVSHARAAVQNNEGATCTILAGTYTRSMENGGSATDNGGNSYYTINNQGTMVIGAENGANNITVTANGHYSSLVHNGWQNSSDAVSKSAIMTIYGGIFTGGINTIKNDESGTLTIYDGTFNNVTQYAVQNWNKATINGGTFESSTMAAVFNGLDTTGTSDGQLTIIGGTFVAPSNSTVIQSNNKTGTKVEITGGNYTGRSVTNATGPYNEGAGAIIQADGSFKVGSTEGLPTDSSGNVYVDDTAAAANNEASVTTSEGVTTYYATLGDAIEKAPENSTVTLLQNIDNLSSNGITETSSAAIIISKPLTLDGNGHSITAASDFGNTNMINVTNSGAVTIKNLTVNGAGNSRHCINIWSGTGTESKANVTLENVKTTGGLTGVTVGGSDATIQGSGTNIATGSWNVAVNVDSTASGNNPASLTVKEGTIGIIYFENTAGTEQVSAAISGGNIAAVAVKDKDGTTEDIDNVSVTITGGTFTNDVSAYLAPGLVQNSDGAVSYPYVPPVITTPGYAVSVAPTANGTVSVNPASASQGAVVTITATPSEGYELTGLTVTTVSGAAVAVQANPNGTYSFVMPGSQVTVSAAFGAERLPFSDVDGNNWFYDAVRYVYINGLMNGVDGGRFDPYGTTTRGQIVSILYRLAGEPDISNENLGYPYEDVDAGSWYADAVYWARITGIADGYDNGSFGPNDSITREQMAAMLYRYAEYMGYDVTGGAGLDQFPDGDETSAWAEDSMSWAIAEGLIFGVDGNVLQPQGSAIRAQAATILMRFCENVAK